MDDPIGVAIGIGALGLSSMRSMLEKTGVAHNLNGNIRLSFYKSK